MRTTLFKILSTLGALLVLFSISVWVPNMVKAQYREYGNNKEVEYRLDEYAKRIEKAELTLDHLKALEVEVTTATELVKWEIGLLAAMLTAALTFITKWVMTTLKRMSRDQQEMRESQRQSRHSIMNLIGYPMVTCLEEKHPELAKDLQDALRRINSGGTKIHEESNRFKERG